ncbi:putative glycolipid-binding domain-containing protein [Solihabitans fulvus]|uniref:Putative glycolipid-binding domain-containing protein n=1 Tax=Solihabitans fulvus TaxID=1892852 RepID=A0A5B2XFZ2_9PSEU|nr:putative glycolipid-binding domain-containing protein [Solihabitans fulvus]KAA2262186.1 putative glycolipid-binding domain-containing protein [Solihabitans fulvus]
MNVSDTTERVLSDGGTRSASTPSRRPRVLTWQGVDAPRLESVRLLLSDNRLRASGRLVAAAHEDAEAHSASFELSVNESRGVSRLLLRSTTAEFERQISLSRSEDGIWLVDSGKGAERTDFDGALDLDVQNTVLFNALPVHRLGLHHTAGEHDLPVVYVTLPDLSVRLLRQTYRTVSVGDQESVVNYTRGSVTEDITVDADGLVLDYPGLSRRV